jgi:hypothetical protein
MHRILPREECAHHSAGEDSSLHPATGARIVAVIKRGQGLRQRSKGDGEQVKQLDLSSKQPEILGAKIKLDDNKT